MTAQAPVGHTGAAPGQPVPSGSADTSQIRPRPSRTFLLIAAILAAGWALFLALLAAYTANPVTLNREQILASSYVVTATVAGDPAEGRVSVEREWKKQALSGTVAVIDLPAAGARRGTAYLIPLSRSDDALRVTEAPDSTGAPLIYPATPDALKQLRTILAYHPDHPTVR